MENLIEILIEALILITENSDTNNEVIRLKKVEKNVGSSITHDKKELFLLFAILMYLFYENDNTFTTKESNLLNKELKLRKSKFDKGEYRIFKSIIYKKHNMEFIEELIIKENYYQVTIYNVIRTVREILKNNKEYINVIRSLEVTLNQLV